MPAPLDGACTSLSSHPTLYCCSPSLMGDSTNAVTIDVSQARKSHPSSHIEDKCAVHITATTWRSGRINISDQSTPAPSCRRRGASVVPHRHSPQCFSQSQCWIQQLFVPQIVPNCVPKYDLPLAVLVKVGTILFYRTAEFYPIFWNLWKSCTCASAPSSFLLFSSTERQKDIFPRSMS